MAEFDHGEPTAGQASTIRSGGMTGALVAAGAGVGIALLPLALAPFSPRPLSRTAGQTLAYLPLIVLVLLSFAVVYASFGALVGVLAVRTGKPVLGCLVGALIFGGVSLLYVLNLPRQEPREERLGVLVSALTSGYVAGGMAALVGGVRRTVRPTNFVFLHRLLLFLPALVLLLAWETSQFRTKLAVWRIEELGGDVGWDAVSEAYEYHRVDLRRGRVDDGTMKELSSSLARFRRLDLILDQCPITDEALESLAGLENLARIHLHGTRVTQEGVARLKDRLPGVEVNW
jgi:hypothetical protein